jgi:hypothetical protein
MVTSSRETRISSIINTRKPFLTEIEKKQTELNKRAKAIYELGQLQIEIMKNGSPMMVDQVKDLPLPALWQKIMNAIQDLEKPKSRFARSTLNIGVIGRARQGKSRLLQSLSGLSSEVIPTGSAGHCTGVRSLICHDSGQKYGEVTFYSEKEFIEEVITPYYNELGLGNPPTGMSSFANTPLPILPASSPNMRNKYVQAGEMYRHLVDYKNNIRAYGNLINSAPIRIPIHNVREYVAQDSVDAKTSYYKYLAVKEARIVCTFEHPDVGQIALVDMPGLGDTGVGAEDRLIAALGENLDVILFVLMPTPAAGILADVDFRLYDLAYNALSGLPIDRWSYMILNQTRPSGSWPSSPHFGDNLRNCERIKNMITTGNTGISGISIKVVDCIIADCSNATEAKDTVLEEVLQYLVHNIGDLDRLYMSSWQKRLAQLQAEITSELERARLALNSTLSQSQDNQAFERMFEILWKKLTTSLDDLVRKLEKGSQTPNTVFVNYLQRTCAKCRSDTIVPSAQEILLDHGDTYAYINVFNNSLNDMRTHLTYHFVDMDDQLRIIMEDVKAEVGEVFLNDGQLAGWLANEQKSEFFAEMAKENMLSERLQRNFQVFAEYELSLRGFFQSHIRRCLDEMKPDRVTIQLTSASPEEVRKLLEKQLIRTVELLESTLGNYMTEPSDAVLAIVEEFVDQICRSKGVKNIWRAFYHSNKDKIWEGELQLKWQNIVKNAIDVNNASILANFKAFASS